MKDIEDTTTIDSYLKNTIEKIIFNEKDLDQLKGLIDNLPLAPNESKELKEKIIQGYIKISLNLQKFLPFFIKREMKRLSIDNFANQKTLLFPQKDISKELLKKSNLLEEINQRLDNIYIKLRQKLNV